MQEPQPSPSATRARWIVLGFLTLSAVGAYLTRNCIAVANTTMQADLKLTDEQMGWIMGIFGLGYSLCQVPGGWLGNRFGTRTALAGMNFAWSLCLVMTGMVSSFFLLFLSRILYGVSQAGMVPVSGKIVSDWFPETRRGFCSSFITAAMSAGAALSLWLTALLIKELSWRTIFLIYSSFGMLWAIAFYSWFRTTPDQHSGVNTAELDLIRSGRKDATSPENEISRPAITSDIAYKLMTNRSIWGVCLQAHFRAAGYAIFVSWLPAFLEYRFDASPTLSGKLATWPLITSVIGSLLGGILIDHLLTKYDNKKISRSYVAIVALFSCGLISLASTWTDSINLFIVLISLGMFLFGGTSPATWAATMDLAGKQTALVLAVMNMAGTFGGFTMPVILGYLIGDIKQTQGDWNLVIYTVTATYFAAGASWILVNPNHPADGTDNVTRTSEETLSQ